MFGGLGVSIMFIVLGRLHHFFYGFLFYLLRPNDLVFMGIEVWLQVWLGYRFGVYGYGGQ